MKNIQFSSNKISDGYVIDIRVEVSSSEYERMLDILLNRLDEKEIAEKKLSHRGRKKIELSREVLDQMINDIDNGISLEDTCYNYGVSINIFNREVKRYGLEYTEVKRARISKVDTLNIKEVVADINRKGGTVGKVARKYGVSYPTLTRYLTSLGYYKVGKAFMKSEMERK